MLTRPDKDTEMQLFPPPRQLQSLYCWLALPDSVPSQGLANKDAKAVSAPVKKQRSHSKGREIGYLRMNATLLRASSELASHRTGQRRLWGCGLLPQAGGARAPSRRRDDAVSCSPARAPRALRPRAPAPAPVRPPPPRTCAAQPGRARGGHSRPTVLRLALLLPPSISDFSAVPTAAAADAPA